MYNLFIFHSNSHKILKMKKNKNKIIIICILSLLFTGCSSFGRGITEAILEKKEGEDTRICEVWGDEFKGLQPYIERKKGTMKVLMVHGVGDHNPGYSTEFFEKLAKELELTVKSRSNKNIRLTDPEFPEKSLGNLRISRFKSKDREQEVMFYELTWSEITAKEKEVLAYDNSGEYSFRRAEVNDMLKRFSNDTGPDPIIYLGESREDILLSFTQSVCWMTYGSWDDLPSNTKEACMLPDVSSIIDDHFAFVSHSLGSRITIDGVQRITTNLKKKGGTSDLYQENIRAALKNKKIPVFMMSNQLPMLQLGRKLPEISNQKELYCSPEGSQYSERMLARTPIIAFSDPNDILSYAIPPGFVEKYLDSRLCIDVTNININVAYLYDVFGVGKLANPMDAHIGYDTDDRVVALIAKGIGNQGTADIVTERCDWIELSD